MNYQVENIEQENGAGLTGQIEGEKYSIGSESYIRRMLGKRFETIESAEDTSVFVNGCEPIGSI